MLRILALVDQGMTLGKTTNEWGSARLGNLGVVTQGKYITTRSRANPSIGPVRIVARRV